MLRHIPILLLLVTLAGCSKKGENNSLVGKWRHVEYFDTSSGGCTCLKSVNEIQAYTIEFRMNGQWTITQPLIASLSGCTGTYKFDRPTLTINTTACASPFAQVPTYSIKINNDTLEVNGLGGLFVKSKYVRRN